MELRKKGYFSPKNVNSFNKPLRKFVEKSEKAESQVTRRKMHTFYVYSGNYSGGITKALTRRGVWILIYLRHNNFPKEQLAQIVVEGCDFVWKPTNTSEFQNIIERRLYEQNGTMGKMKTPFIWNHF